MPLHFAKGSGICISDLRVVTVQFQLLSEETEIGPPKSILSGDYGNEVDIFILAFSAEARINMGTVQHISTEQNFMCLS